MDFGGCNIDFISYFFSLNLFSILAIRLGIGDGRLGKESLVLPAGRKRNKELL